MYSFDARVLQVRLMHMLFLGTAHGSGASPTLVAISANSLETAGGVPRLVAKSDGAESARKIHMDLVKELDAFYTLCHKQIAAKLIQEKTGAPQHPAVAAMEAGVKAANAAGFTIWPPSDPRLTLMQVLNTRMEVNLMASNVKFSAADAKEAIPIIQAYAVACGATHEEAYTLASNVRLVNSSVQPDVITAQKIMSSTPIPAPKPGMTKFSFNREDVQLNGGSKAIAMEELYSAFWVMGESYARMDGMIEQSTAAFEEALRLKPEDVDVYVAIGKNYATLADDMRGPKPSLFPEIGSKEHQHLMTAIDTFKRALAFSEPLGTANSVMDVWNRADGQLGTGSESSGDDTRRGGVGGGGGGFENMLAEAANRMPSIVDVGQDGQASDPNDPNSKQSNESGDGALTVATAGSGSGSGSGGGGFEEVSGRGIPIYPANLGPALLGLANAYVRLSRTDGKEPTGNPSKYGSPSKEIVKWASRAVLADPEFGENHNALVLGYITSEKYELALEYSSAAIAYFEKQSRAECGDTLGHLLMTRASAWRNLNRLDKCKLDLHAAATAASAPDLRHMIQAMLHAVDPSQPSPNGSRNKSDAARRAKSHK